VRFENLKNYFSLVKQLNFFTPASNFPKNIVDNIDPWIEIQNIVNLVNFKFIKKLVAQKQNFLVNYEFKIGQKIWVISIMT